MSIRMAFVGSMAGYGFGHSIVMGYGPLHGLGMAAVNLLFAIVLVAVWHLFRGSYTWLRGRRLRTEGDA